MSLSLIAALLAIISISSALDAYSKEFSQFIQSGNSTHKAGLSSYNLNSYSKSSMNLQYQYALKDQSRNSFTAYFKISFDKRQIQSLYLDQQILITNYYIDSNGLLAIQADYTVDLNRQITLKITLPYTCCTGNTGNTLQKILYLSLKAENNLSLKSYSSETYVLAAGVKYFCLALSLVSILLLIAGYFGGKLIVLEHLAVLQLVALCQLTVHDASSTFAGLRSLQLSLGFTPLAPYDYSSSVGREFKGSSYSSNLLSNLNFALLLVLVPPLAGLTCKILSLTLCKEKPLLTKLCPLLFGENTFFGLVACSYAILSLFIFNLVIINGGENSYLSIISMVIFAFLIIAFCYFLNQLPFYFGDFKKMFQKYNIYTYFYNFVLLERLLSSVAIILLRNQSYGIIFEVMIVCTQLAFVAIRNPYICGDYCRPLINLSTAALCVFIIFLRNILPSVAFLQLYAPIVICLLLGALFCSNLYYQIRELIRIRRQVKESHQTGQTQKVFDGLFRYEDPDDIKQKQRFHLQEFRRQIIDDHEDTILASQGFKFMNISNKRKLSNKWNEYAILQAKKPAVQLHLIGNHNVANDDV